MSKKSIKVQEVLDMVNNSLAKYQSDSTADTGEICGMIALLEQILHTTGNYNGFRYLEEREVPFGCLPGIRFYVEDQFTDLKDKFADTDSSRRHYF